jgi:hypothetical protein
MAGAHPARTRDDDGAELIDEASEWGVLGVTRLHDTLATRAPPSKRSAGTRQWSSPTR